MDITVIKMFLHLKMLLNENRSHVIITSSACFVITLTILATFKGSEVKRAAA